MNKHVPIEELNLRSKTYDRLKKNGIDYLDDLISKSQLEIQYTLQLGQSELDDVQNSLNKLGLKLRDVQ